MILGKRSYLHIITRLDTLWVRQPLRQVAVLQMTRLTLILIVHQHATSNHVIDISAVTASGRCDVVVLVQLPDRRWIAGGGSYEDDYRNVDGSWRIAYRKVVRPFDLAPLAPADGPGEVNHIPG